MATFLPAGTVKETLRKMGRSGWYPKETFSKRISPPVRLSGFEAGESWDESAR